MSCSMSTHILHFQIFPCKLQTSRFKRVTRVSYSYSVVQIFWRVEIHHVMSKLKVIFQFVKYNYMISFLRTPYLYIFVNKYR